MGSLPGTPVILVQSLARKQCKDYLLFAIPGVSGDTSQQVKVLSKAVCSGKESSLVWLDVYVPVFLNASFPHWNNFISFLTLKSLMCFISSLFGCHLQLYFSGVLQTYEVDLLIVLMDSISGGFAFQPFVAGFAKSPEGWSVVQVVVAAAARLSHCSKAFAAVTWALQGREEGVGLFDSEGYCFDK